MATTQADVTGIDFDYIYPAGHGTEHRMAETDYALQTFHNLAKAL
jgi:hypothetical protein